MIWKQFLYNFMVLLNGPVKNALFCLMGPVPECLRLVHGKELPVPKGWNSLLPTWEPQVTIARNCRFQRLELLVPNLGTRGHHCKQLPVPTWEPQVAIAKNFQFLKVGTDGSQRGNQRLPLQGIAGSQTLEFMFSKLSVYHCKELRVSQSLKLMVPSLKK